MLKNNLNSGNEQIEQLDKMNQQKRKEIKDTELLIERKEADISNSQAALNKAENQVEAAGEKGL